MRLGNKRSISSVVAAVSIAFGLVACGADTGSGSLDPTGESGNGGPTASSGGNTGTGSGAGTAGTSTGEGSPAPGSGTSVPVEPAELANRKLDYGEALRTASLKLLGDLPNAEQLKGLTAAATPDAQKAFYEQQVDAMLKDPRFTERLIQWWRDTFRTGGQGPNNVSFETAAVFAAQVVVEERPFTDLFTATKDNCPTFANGQFTAATCQGAPAQAGVLTNPGLMAQYYANMAFRRVRFVQETFACTKFPAEYAEKPTPMGASLYTSPWPFTSITGGQGSRINFQDTSSVICANCHTTMNHIAPLFANFDMNGAFNAQQVAVETPVVSNDPAVRRTRLSDFLPEGQTTAWRNGKAVANLTELGAAMAADPDVARCAVNRVWNWAFSRGDIVGDLATVPPSVTDALVADFKASNMSLKKVIRATFTAPDFVRF